MTFVRDLLFMPLDVVLYVSDIVSRFTGWAGRRWAHLWPQPKHAIPFTE